MRMRANLQIAVLLAAAAGLSPARALTQGELVTRLEVAGYSEIRDIKSTAEGITAKAMKNGKAVRVVVDSNGQVKEQN